MIAYLEGKLIHRDEERVVVLANQVGYEVMLPAFVMATVTDFAGGEMVCFHIYFHQTERQPRPVLIGFTHPEEKAFFQQFLTVEAIGPLKAVKALTLPMADVARAIEQGDAALLGRLRGIGARTAQKIIATLSGKMAAFSTSVAEAGGQLPPNLETTTRQVLDVMVNQLGHRLPEARKMIADALKRNSAISSPESLLDEIYRGEASHDR